MTTKVNIGGDPLDASYRYKRDVIIIERVKKQGGLLKISNIDTICKQLRVGAEFKKFFYKKIKSKGIPFYGENLFKAGLSTNDLEKILEQLIKEHVLCPTCKLPEWNGKLCSACGHRKQGKKKSEDDDEDDDEVEASIQVKQAVQLCKKLYDLRAQSENRYLIDKCIDEFWRIETDVLHEKWTNKANEVFFPPLSTSAL